VNLSSAAPSILMSVIALLSPVSRVSSWSSTTSVSVTTHQPTRLRASRLPRRPEIEFQTARRQSTPDHGCSVGQLGTSQFGAGSHLRTDYAHMLWPPGMPHSASGTSPCRGPGGRAMTTRTDSDIKCGIEAELRRSLSVDEARVAVRVIGGAVTLTSDAGILIFCIGGIFGT
jgi:hypothetical protein